MVRAHLAGGAGSVTGILPGSSVQAAVGGSNAGAISSADQTKLNALFIPTGNGIPHVVSGVLQAAATLLVDADVSATAAIAGSKVSPIFGAQTVTTSAGLAAPSGIRVQGSDLFAKHRGRFELHAFKRGNGDAQSASHRRNYGGHPSHCAAHRGRYLRGHRQPDGCLSHDLRRVVGRYGLDPAGDDRHGRLRRHQLRVRLGRFGRGSAAPDGDHDPCRQRDHDNTQIYKIPAQYYRGVCDVLTVLAPVGGGTVQIAVGTTTAGAQIIPVTTIGAAGTTIASGTADTFANAAQALYLQVVTSARSLSPGRCDSPADTGRLMAPMASWCETRVRASAGAPTITSVFPPILPTAGGSAVFAGTNLSGATAATICGVSCTVTGSTSTTATVTVGALSATAGTPGSVSVTTSGGTATLSSSFVVPATYCDNHDASIAASVHSSAGSISQVDGKTAQGTLSRLPEQTSPRCTPPIERAQYDRFRQRE